MVARSAVSDEGSLPALTKQRVDSRQAILDAAAKLFREKGYASVSLREVASNCGMRAGSLYYHFSSKDEIVAEVLRVGVDLSLEHVKASVNALPTNAPPQQLLGTAILAHLEAILERQDYASANVRIFGQVPAQVRAAHAGSREAYEAYWDGLLAVCVKRQRGKRTALQIHAARSFLIGAMNATLEWFDPARAPIEQLAAELTGIFLGGVSSTWPAGGRAAALKKQP